jgi:hypothetical protein
MPKGGARASSGPVPDPNALRRDRPADKASWTVLPAEGRSGDAPAWPLWGRSDREAELWLREWRRPQATVWERNGQEEEVAMYVRSFAAAELPNATTAARTLVRQQQEALGLSMPGLLRLRWRIGEPEAAAPVAAVAPASGSARGRFKVVGSA